MRLGAWMPFDVAAGELTFFWQVQVSEATVRRHAYAAGEAYAAVQAAQLEQIEREQLPEPLGPPLQLVSADGAMVPLVGGEWAEAKTLAIGTVRPPRHTPETGEWQVHTTELSYFSRLSDAETFSRLALVEFHARGTETAGRVVGVMDGSDWLQGLLDTHRPDAVRVLDFPHAVEHLTSAAQAVFGSASPAAATWVAAQAHELKHGAAEHVLQALGALPVAQALDPLAAAQAQAATLGYLRKRREQIRYAEFRAQGYPIGSGCVESANKLVVEARLKGAGMHWARAHVSPMLALRSIACSGRWSTAWPQIVAERRAQAQRRRAARRRARQLTLLAASAPPTAPLPPPPPLCGVPPRATPTIVHGRPTAAHPWKRRPLFIPRDATALNAKS